MLKILVENWDKIVWPTGSSLVESGTACSNTDLLLEIRLDKRQGFSAGLEKDIVEFRNSSACAKSL